MILRAKLPCTSTNERVAGPMRPVTTTTAKLFNSLTLMVRVADWPHYHQAVFKIEVFNALQTRFSPSKYAFLKTTLQNATPN
jgi:hypothetical protein